MKTILITGASSGIGKALAKEFHAQGFKVYAGARRVDNMKDLAELGIKTCALDVTDDSSIDKLKQQLEPELGGKLDYLYNNAGVSFQSHPALDVPWSEVQNIYNVNVFGALKMDRAFAPWIVAAKGTIIYTGSNVCDVYPPWAAHYNASKAALRGYINTLRAEMEPLGVKIVEINTGAVHTEMSQPREPKPLNEDSLFVLAESALAKTREISKRPRTNSDDYAKSVVSQLNTGKDFISGGHYTTMTYWVGKSDFLKRRLLDSAYGLGLFKKAVSESQAAP